MTPPSAPPIRRKKKLQTADEEEQRNDPAEDFRIQRLVDLAGELHLLRLEILDQLRIVDADRA